MRFMLLILLCVGCVDTRVTRPGFALSRQALFNKIEASEITFERITVTEFHGATNTITERIVFRGPKSDATKALETIDKGLDLMKSLPK